MHISLQKVLLQCMSSAELGIMLTHGLAGASRRRFQYQSRVHTMNCCANGRHFTMRVASNSKQHIVLPTDTLPHTMQACWTQYIYQEDSTCNNVLCTRCATTSNPSCRCKHFHMCKHDNSSNMQSQQQQQCTSMTPAATRTTMTVAATATTVPNMYRSLPP